MKLDPKGGGAHLRVVREWMQRKAVNGDTCTQGSDEILRLRYNVTPKLLEELAADIAVAVAKDILSAEDIDEAWKQAGQPKLCIKTEGQLVSFGIEDTDDRDYLSLESALRCAVYRLLKITALGIA